jgi:hypothetical protein
MIQCSICLSPSADGMCAYHILDASEWATVNRLMNNALMRGRWPSKAAIDAYAEGNRSDAITVDESV